jgi:MraZ protein
MVEMMLTGKFHRSLDDKQRFAIPKPLRDALGFPQSTAFYVCPGTDESISLYSEPAFSLLADRLQQFPPTGQDVRTFRRLFFAQVQRVEIDRQGRIRLPTDLVELASIQKEIVLLGVGDHVEIWDADRWQVYLNSKQPHYDEIAESAFTGRKPSNSQENFSVSVERSEATDVSTEQRPIQPR